jgi:long-chain acyl-CoA synthetase
MPEGFSVSNGTLTPTLKLKRKEVLKKYAIQIDDIYEKSNI